MGHENIEREVAAYYGGKLKEKGATAAGVDWNSKESQELRFAQLLKVTGDVRDASILDWGCGYGALVEYMARNGFATAGYTGFDVAPEMVAEAKRQHPGVAFTMDRAALPKVDFTVCSGIFNVRQQQTDDVWKQYVIDTLDAIRALSTKGFAFNMLTSYSDKEKMRDYLYYADPCFFFDLCKRRYSKSVALLHDYGLYEFTLLVR